MANTIWDDIAEIWLNIISSDGINNFFGNYFVKKYIAFFEFLGVSNFFAMLFLTFIFLIFLAILWDIISSIHYNWLHKYDKDDYEDHSDIWHAIYTK